MVTKPEKNNKRAYGLQRNYRQNRSDNYYLLSFAAGCGLAGLFGQSAYVWGYSLGWMSLFWSLYEFHGDTIIAKYNEKMYGEKPLFQKIQEESEEMEQVSKVLDTVIEDVKDVVNGEDK